MWFDYRSRRGGEARGGGGGIIFLSGCSVVVVREGFKQLSRCSLAALAQFFPKKHPDHWHVLVGALVAYAVCTMVLNALLWRMENDAFLFAVSDSDSESVCNPPPQHAPPIRRFIGACHLHVPSRVRSAQWTRRDVTLS